MSPICNQRNVAPLAVQMEERRFEKNLGKFNW